MNKKIAAFRRFLMNGFVWNPKLVPDIFKPVMSWYQKTGDDAKAGMALMRYMGVVEPIVERPMGEAAVSKMLVKVEPWKTKYEENLRKLQDQMQDNLKRTVAA